MLSRVINFGIYIIVFSLPLYLFRFKIGWVPFNLLELMIYGLFLVWLIKYVFYNNTLKLNLIGKKWFYPIFLIFLGVTISTFFSADLLLSAGIWKGWFIAPLLFFIVVINKVKNKEEIKNILLSLTLSGFAVGLIALYYWLNNNLTYDGRLRAFYLSPNHLAMYLSPILILSLSLHYFFKKNIYKIILFIIQLILFIIIYLTYSYGAWFGLLIGFSFIFFIILREAGQPKKCIRPPLNFFGRLDFSLILIAIIFILLIIFFAFQIPTNKFQQMVDFSYPSLKSRLVIWQSAWEIIKTTPHNFLWGVGPGMFQKYYLDYQPNFDPYPEWAVPQPHNIFLAFWLQAGLFGLIGFFWLIIQFFLIYKKAAAKIIIFLAAAIIYILIHGLTDTTYWKNDLSVIFWLIIALSCKAGRLADW